VRMGSLLIIAALCTMPLSERQAAHADYIAQPIADQPYTRYLSLSAVPEATRETWANAMKFAVPSASRALVLDHQIPYQLPGTNLYRINLQRLNWKGADWDKVLERYPYSDKKYPLVIRGDWLVYVLADTRDFDAYYRLLYGGASIPKNVNQFLNFWKVDAAQQSGQRFGWAETKSQVAKQESRFIERFNAGGNSLWITKDVFKIDRNTDPLEHLEGDLKHDGREAIAVIPKVSLEHRTSGGLQVYGLFNAQDKVVNEAPVRLVEDYGRTAGQTAIINNSSCVTCHTRGMNPPSENGLQSLITSGVELNAYYKDKQEQIEAFHLSDVGKKLERDCEDYELAVKACNGLTGPQNAIGYKVAIEDYLADLTLERAACELYTTPETLRNALAYASSNYIDIGARLSGLAHGRTVPRHTFEPEALKLAVYLETWREK
jgi:hypothetical protein